MKRNLLFCGVAALAFASCTQNEVLDVNESRAIGFDAFVGNNTRAVTDLTKDDLEKFYVFGDYDAGASIAFSNTEVNGSSTGGTYTPVNPAYWITGKTYTFGAYANGKYVAADQSASTAEISAKLGNVEFKNGSMTIDKYTVNDNNDLVAAVVTNVTAPAANTEQSVPLSFKHLLSKIKFTFSTTAVPEAYKLEITSIEFYAKKTNAKCTFNGTNIIWDESTGDPDKYTVPKLADYAIEGGKASTDDILVIPQANNSITATITVNMYDEATYEEGGSNNTAIATNQFTATLGTSKDNNVTGDVENKWIPGYVYNYTAEINPDDVNDQMKEIKFTVTEVEEWKEHDKDNDYDPITPTVVIPKP